MDAERVAFAGVCDCADSSRVGGEGITGMASEAVSCKGVKTVRTFRDVRVGESEDVQGFEE